MPNKKKNIILSIIGITLILIILLGATYAYFQAQIKDGTSSDIAIDADTVDVLTFKASNDISFEVTQENFKAGAGNISGTTTLNAHLIANNTNQTASYKYNVYLDITRNNFVYSKDSNTPEIVLVIKNPKGQYVNSYNSKLGSSKNVDLNGTNVPGYDITTKIGLIEISLDYIIDASPSTKGEKDQNWEISVVFVNLDSNQVANAGKSFKAKAKVQSEKINVLDLGGTQYAYYRGSSSSSKGYREQIKNVKFVNYIAPEEELKSVVNWDLSSSKDKSIMGWLKEENEDTIAPYNLYIGSNLKEGEKIVVRSFAYAFYLMTNLETIDLNLDILDTSNLNDTSNMFVRTSSLTTITGIENLDVSNVIDMSSMFQSVNSSIIPDISNWNTSQVTDMSGLFRSTSYNYDVSKIDTHNVTNMSYMFSNYQGTEITGIEDLDVSNVTTMSNMFYDAQSLTSLNLSNWDTHNVTDMSSMFSRIISLNELDISNWDTSNVTDMHELFAEAIILTELDISNWDTHNVTNMSRMFANKRKLTELDLSNWDTSNVTDMSYMFYDGGFSMTLTTMGDISNWDTHNVTNMSFMFSGAGNLTTLDLSKWDTHNVTNMSSMFSGASGLTSLDMRKATFRQLTSYSDMFKGTNSALQVTITGDDNKDWFETNNVFPLSNYSDTQILEVLPE